MIKVDDNSKNADEIAEETREWMRDIECVNIRHDNEDFINGLIKIISMAKERCVLVSANLSVDIFGKPDVIECTRKQMENGVSFVCITGKEIVVPNKGEHPFLSAFMNSANTSPRENRIDFYYRKNRPPALHYFYVDNRIVLSEVIHRREAEVRSYVVIDKPELISVYCKKFDHCISNHIILPVTNMSEYEIVSEFSERYKSYYEETLYSFDLRLAEENPKEWLVNCLISERINQQERENSIAFARQYGNIVKSNFKYFDMHEKEIAKRYQGNWIAISSGEVIAFNPVLKKVIAHVEREYPALSFSAVLLKHISSSAVAGDELPVSPDVAIADNPESQPLQCSMITFDALVSKQNENWGSQTNHTIQQ